MELFSQLERIACDTTNNYKQPNTAFVYCTVQHFAAECLRKKLKSNSHSTVTN
eukprot:m.40899 g.40899  ORF g.40899 m.40899 type:complete len:53 (-) comp6960_c0_seq1:2314-2472(-)